MFALYWQKISHGSGYPAFFFALGKAAKAQETQSYQRFQHIVHTVFNTSSTNGHVRFHRRKRVHTRLHSKDRTQRLTRRNTGRFRRVVVSLSSARFACYRNAGRPLVKTTHLPFSWSGYFFVDFSGINYAPIRNLENLKGIPTFVWGGGPIRNQTITRELLCR